MNTQASSCSDCPLDRSETPYFPISHTSSFRRTHAIAPRQWDEQIQNSRKLFGSQNRVYIYIPLYLRSELTMSCFASGAFDRVAKMLNLAPTGSALAQVASAPPLAPFDTSPLAPLLTPLSTRGDHKRLEFSYSGLVTHTENLLKRVQGDLARQVDSSRSGGKEGQIQENVQREVGRVFQEAAVRHVCEKIELCLKMGGGEGVRGLVVSGGVGSNLHLRKRYGSPSILSLDLVH
jgi:hypothetical protein